MWGSGGKGSVYGQEIRVASPEASLVFRRGSESGLFFWKGQSAGLGGGWAKVHSPEEEETLHPRIVHKYFALIDWWGEAVQLIIH